MNTSVIPHGQFNVEHWRYNRMIGLYTPGNSVTDEGINALLNLNFHNGNKILHWWFGLIGSVGYTQLSTSDTYANINLAGNGWVEFTGYTDPQSNGDSTTRPMWRNDPASSKKITNTTKSLFNITTAGTIKGIFSVCGPTSQLKNDNTLGNVLWSAALLNKGDVSVSVADQFRVVYAVML